MTVLNLQSHIVFALVLLILVNGSNLTVAQQVNDQYGLAAGHYERGEYTDAIDGFRALIDQFPNSQQAAFSYFFLGESLVQETNYQSAYPSFQIFIKNHPDHQYTRRAQFRMAECAYRLDWTAQATSQLEKFVERYPTDPLNEYALNYLGELRLTRGEPQLAQQVFQRAIDSFPNSTQSNRNRFGLAKSLQAQGNESEALRFYKMLTVNSAEPLHGLASMQIGIISFSAGDYAHANENLLTATASTISEKRRVEAKYWLARTQMAMGHYETALKYFSEITDETIEDPLKAAILFDGSIAASRSGELETATAWLSRLQKTWPDSKWADDALQLEIELLYQQRQFDDAQQRISTFKERFTDHANLPIVLEFEGRIYYDRGQHQETIDTFQTLLDRFGKQAEYQNKADVWRYFLGLGNLGLQNYQRAASELGDIQIHNMDREFRAAVLLAEASAAVGLKRHHRAINYLEKFLATDPTGTQADRARSDLAVAYAQSDQWAEAKRILSELEEKHSEGKTLLETTLLLAEYGLLDKQYDYSESCFAKLTKSSNPRNFVVRGLSGLAWVRLSRGDEHSSVDVFERLVNEYGETAFAAESAMVCGRYFEQNSNFERAAEMYSLVQVQFPKTEFAPLAKLREAYSLHQIGGSENLATAESMLDSYRQAKNPNLDEALYQLAWIYLETDRKKQAGALFESIARDCPNSKFWADSAYRVAQNAMQQQDYPQARKLVERLLSSKTDPEIATRSLFLQGQIAVHDQDWTQVESCMRDLLAKTDDESLRKKTRYWMAESLFQLGRYSQAIEELDRLIADPNKITEQRIAWAHLRRAQCCAYQKKWSAALEFAQISKKQFPDFEALHEFDFIIGRSHASQGRLEDARTAYEEVIDSPTGRMTQTAAMAQWRIGETYFHQENYESAIDAFNKVDSLYGYAKWRAAALVEAGKCQEHLGNWKHAMKLYQRLIDKFPESEFCLAAQNRLSTAIRQAARSDSSTKK